MIDMTDSWLHENRWKHGCGPSTGIRCVIREVPRTINEKMSESASETWTRHHLLNRSSVGMIPQYGIAIMGQFHWTLVYSTAKVVVSAAMRYWMNEALAYPGRRPRVRSTQ